MKACPEGIKDIIEKSKPNLGQPENFEEEKESAVDLLSDDETPQPLLMQANSAPSRLTKNRASGQNQSE